MKYKRDIYPLLNRLRSIWKILTKKEYVLIIVSRKNGGRLIQTDFRTDDTKEGDTLTIKGALLGQN